MVINATSINISAISWWSFLLAETTEYPEKTTDQTQVTNKRYHIMLCRVHLVWVGFERTTLLVTGTDCICSCKSNYYTFATTIAPK